MALFRDYFPELHLPSKLPKKFGDEGKALLEGVG